MSVSRPSDMLQPESSERDILLFKCRVAENSERFQDMVDLIKQVISMGDEPLGHNERNNLSVAFKNSIALRRQSLRCLLGMKSKYKAKEYTKNFEIVDEYYNKVLQELKDICDDVLNLIDTVIMRKEIMDNLPENRSSTEFMVFFYKMKADYYRYLSEFNEGEERDRVIKEATSKYKLAMDKATVGGENVILPAAHPIRLGLCLNYSVFLYEILDKPEEAQHMAKHAFDEAVERLGTSEDTEYRDSTVILQLLRDNTALWLAQDNEYINDAE